MWIVLAVSALFCQSIFWIIARSILKKKEVGSVTFTIFFDLVLGLILLPVAFLNGFSIPPLNQIWLNFLLMIVLYATVDIFTYLSLKHTPVSEFIIIRATIPIWTSFAGIPILHESAHPAKIIGIFLSMIGVWVIFYKNEKIKLHQGHLFAFLSAVLYGFAYINDAILLHHFNSATYSSLYFLLPPFLIAAVYPNKIKQVTAFLQKNTIIRFFLAAIPLSLAALSVNTAYKLGGEISQISTIVQLSSILTILFGVLLLKEKDHLIRKSIGGIIVVIVILLMQWK